MNSNPRGNHPLGPQPVNILSINNYGVGSRSRGPFDRRLLLRGAGAAIALPLLNAMVPAVSAVEATAPITSKPPVRLAWIFFPNGTNSGSWLSEAEGDTWKLTPSLEPLAKHRSEYGFVEEIPTQD